jgi:hypothetical protein
MEKTIIGFNSHGYNTTETQFNKIKTLVAELIEISKLSLGETKEVCLKQLTDNPTAYLVNTYSELYKEHFPPTMAAVKMFNNGTDINLAKVDQVHQELQKVLKVCNKVTITSKQVKRQYKKEDFNYYLNEDKRELYDTLKQFIENARKLKSFGAAYGDINLVRYASHISLGGSDLKINISEFIE